MSKGFDELDKTIAELSEAIRDVRSILAHAVHLPDDKELTLEELAKMAAYRIKELEGR